MSRSRRVVWPHGCNDQFYKRRNHRVNRRKCRYLLIKGQYCDIIVDSRTYKRVTNPWDVNDHKTLNKG